MWLIVLNNGWRIAVQADDVHVLDDAIQVRSLRIPKLDIDFVSTSSGEYHRINNAFNPVPAVPL